MYRTVLGQDLDLYKIREMDSGLGASLEKFVAAYNAWSSGDKSEELLIDGQPLSELCLSYELPGAFFKPIN